MTVRRVYKTRCPECGKLADKEAVENLGHCEDCEVRTVNSDGVDRFVTL